MVAQSIARRIVIMEGFLGFTYNNKHSKDFGIIRVISGNRMKEDLLPEITDITQNIEGADGLLYYGSNYKKRDFAIEYAFDGMTEAQKKALQKWLGDGQIHELEFDEKPEIKYQAKVTGKATLSHIPFDENGQTIYKGEGTIVFTCYQPFGKKKITATPASNTYTFGTDSVRAMYPKITFTNLNNELIIRKGTSAGEQLIKIDGNSINKEISIDCEKFLIYDNNGNLYNDTIRSGDFFSVNPGDTLYFSVEPSEIVYNELYY